MRAGPDVAPCTMPVRPLLAVSMLCGCAVALAAAPPSSLARAAAPADAGHVVAIGGALADDNAAVWSKLVALAGGTDAAWIVVPTASEEPLASGERTAARLREHGAKADVLWIAARTVAHDGTRGAAPQGALAADDPAAVARVRAAHGVFFTGGAQGRLVDALRPNGVATPVLDAIRALQREGGVVAGTSAGAAVMSEQMIRNLPDRVGALAGDVRRGEEIDAGLGFLAPGLVVDQHFLRRGRLGRLLPVLSATGSTLGLGVDEDTAAFVHDGTVDVVGRSAVLVVDLARAESASVGRAYGVRNARLALLRAGDRYDLRRREVLPPAVAVPAPLARIAAVDPDGRGASDAPFYVDVLADGALVDALGRLARGPADALRGLASDPGGPRPRLAFEFRLSRDRETVAWATPGGDAIARVRLDVTPVRLADPPYVPLTERDASGVSR
jgi:cyanophycinase